MLLSSSVETEGRMLVGETIDMESGVCAVIDDALLRFRGRTLISGSEVVDFLLDLRIAVDVEARLGALLLPAPS
jgi:hypothetical protein